MIVYKYAPLERLSYLQDEFLRITQPADLNDPFECIPATPSDEDIIKVLKGMFNEKISSISKTKLSKSRKKEEYIIQQKILREHLCKIKNNEQPNFKSYFLDTAKENMNKHLGILSLSRRWDSTLMWSHYTNSHKGICIGFNALDKFFNDFRQVANVDKVFMPVEYTDKRIEVSLIKGIPIDFKVVLSKSSDWSYEEEERLLVMLRQAQKKVAVKPYDIYLYKIPHSLIEEIILGANFPDDKVAEVYKFCTDQGIKLYKSVPSKVKYDMERFIID